MRQLKINELYGYLEVGYKIKADLSCFELGTDTSTVPPQNSQNSTYISGNCRTISWIYFSDIINILNMS